MRKGSDEAAERETVSFLGMKNVTVTGRAEESTEDSRCAYPPKSMDPIFQSLRDVEHTYIRKFTFNLPIRTNCFQQFGEWAEAIRKILGQDSSRKKREEKIKKWQEELAQEKAANAQMIASNTIRTVMGPNGTTLTFSQEMGLPKFFDSKPPSYPPPREKCVGPSCTNAYKYRDSKTKLPLCSLQRYKAIHEKMAKEEAC